MEKINETREHFEDVLNSFGKGLKNSSLTYSDGFVLQNLAQNMLLRFDEIRRSRDRWKAKYVELKNGE